MLLSDIATKGPLAYTHHYNITSTSASESVITLDVPGVIVTLAENYPTAKAVVFGDESVGIEIEGATWATEYPHPEASAKLGRDVWQYLRLALGLDADTRAVHT